jgi:hypothetical protein
LAFSLGVCFLDGTLLLGIISVGRIPMCDILWVWGVGVSVIIDHPWVVVKRCASVISSQLQKQVAKTLRQNKDSEKRIFGRSVVINGKISE